MNILRKLYTNLILRHPLLTLIVVSLLIGGISVHVPKIKLDASADSLVLENDDDLKYFREINSRYETKRFLVITYRPDKNIFADDALTAIGALQKDLELLDGISEVISILNVPLLNSPSIPLEQLTKTIRTLDTPNIDRKLAQQEFSESPLYRELLLSADRNVTALIAYLKEDPVYKDLYQQRRTLREMKYAGKADDEHMMELAIIEKEFRDYQAKHDAHERQQIAKVREIIDRHRGNNEIFLGGVPMIVADMINFIKTDLITFGSAIFLFLIITLTIIFRQLRWVLLPMLCCSLPTVATIGLLGMLDWRITVISSNFIALLLIITMSMTIHLIVRYREMQANDAAQPIKERVTETINFMLKPCFYAALTTVTAFMSLLISGIRPVIDFGYMMTIGVGFAFVLTFMIFPSVLLLMPKGHSSQEKDFTSRLTANFAHITCKHHRIILMIASAIAVASIIGISQLRVENRFIDYFKEHTEIYQGMLTIDRKLGGTTPLDFILRAPPSFPNDHSAAGDSAEDDLLDGYFTQINTETPEKSNYWLTPLHFREIKKIHDYFEARPEIGKVLSLATLVKLAEQLNDNQALLDFETALLPKLLPKEISNILLNPFYSESNNELRFTMRIIDSDKNLQRNELLRQISQDIKAMGYPTDRFRLTNMLVLYNNMLQSLYQSQILTLTAVFLAITLMFVVLFRSLTLAILAIIPNLLAAGLILGFMGWMNIPLDMMTITIAAISIGIAVDNTIHYIIRFKREFLKDYDYFAAVSRCHGSIGKAMYYTSTVIIVGFSILALSNFIPSVHFGLLTGLAMIAAFIAALTLLPSLLIIFRPLEKGSALSSTSQENKLNSAI